LAMQDQQKLSQLMQSGKYNLGDPNSISQMAKDAGASGVSPSGVLALNQKALAQQKTVADIAQAMGTAHQREGIAAKNNFDLANQQATKAAVIAQTISDPAQAQKMLSDLDSEYASIHANRQDYVPLAQQYGAWDPASKAALIAKATTMTEAHKMAFGEDKTVGGQLINVKTPITPGKAPTVTPLYTAQDKSVHPGIGPDGKPGFFQLGPDNKIPEDWKPQPTAAQVSVHTGQSVINPSTFDPSKPMNPSDEAIAQARAAGNRDTITSSRGNANGNLQEARAQFLYQQAHPGETTIPAGLYANAKTGLSSFAPGKVNGNTINAINTMAEHLDTARQMATALQAGNLPMVNKLAQGLGIQVGDNATTNFNTLKQFLSGEVAKVAAGGHLTEGEIKLAADKLNAAGSPAQLTGALDTMSQVAGGKLKALDVDYKNYSGGKSLVDAGRLSPASKAAFQSVQSGHSIPNLTNLHTNGKQTIGWNGKAWVDQSTGQEVK